MFKPFINEQTPNNSTEAKAARRMMNLFGHIMPNLPIMIEPPQQEEMVNEECAAINKDTQGVKYFDESGLSALERQRKLKFNGWGYKDTEFTMNKKNDVYLSGTRYLNTGKVLPNFRPWFEKFVGLDIKHSAFAQPITAIKVPSSILNEGFVKGVESLQCYKRICWDDETRLFHAHGHTVAELFKLRYSRYERVPDVVIYPGKHEDVEKLVKLACEHNVCVIPYGGGTSVTQAVECPTNEKRMIVSLDMQEMNRIKWVDKVSMLACIEAGALGKDIHEKLGQQGLTLGHEPDSYELSTMGGWVATRASGMKKNIYGNIEDFLINVKAVTPLGTYEKGGNFPRASTGPDINNLMLGSEGTLGVITECVVKVRRVPACKEYGSIVFPDLETGVKFMYEVAMRRYAPASIRLVDNSQFQIGSALKPQSEGPLDVLEDWMGKIYITKYCGFDPEKLTAVTLLFEGEKNEIELQQKRIYEISAKYGGIKAGAANGIRGYLLTYVIAYLRDYGFNYYFLAESFETSVPWANCYNMCVKVKERIYKSYASKHIPYGKPWVSCRVTQTYDSGACVYFYFGFLFRGVHEPVKIYSEIEEEAREEVLHQGGSVSHHHGIGKLRKHFTKDAVGETGVTILKSVKKAIDPQNVFGNGNMFNPL